MTITEFLLARIAEDEDRARAAGGAYATRSDGPDGAEAAICSVAGERLVFLDMEAMVRLDRSTLALAEHLADWLPGRVLAECEAKRGAVTLAWAYSDGPEHPRTLTLADDILRNLAMAYADHPDYREEWKR